MLISVARKILRPDGNHLSDDIFVTLIAIRYSGERKDWGDAIFGKNGWRYRLTSITERELSSIIWKVKNMRMNRPSEPQCSNIVCTSFFSFVFRSD